MNSNTFGIHSYVVEPSEAIAITSPAPMRVLHCSVALGGGGAERQLRNFLLHGKSEAIEHAVFAWRDGEFATELRAAGIPVFLVPSERSRPFRAVLALSDVIRQWRPNLMQTWSPQFDVVAPFVARQAQIPVVGSERNSQFVYQDKAVHGRRWYSVLRPFAFRYGGFVAICANSPSGSRYLVEDLKVRIPVHTIPNGLDLCTINAATPATRESLALPAGTKDPVILVASRLTAVKRVDLILSALVILRERGFKPHVLICGSGIELEPLRAMTTNLDLHDQVRFLGQRQDILSVMKASDLFCTSSQGEGLPNSSLEAMACGLPVLASDISPHRDLFEPVRAGKLFASGSSKALADALEGLLASSSLRRELGEAGRIYSSQFGVSRMCDQFNGLYQSLIPVREKPVSSSNKLHSSVTSGSS